MKNIFVEENGVYKLDCSRAKWATDEVHAAYQKAKLHLLKDVDFIIEDVTDGLFMVEYKNATISGAMKPEAFQPGKDDKIRNTFAMKFYGVLPYLSLIGKESVPTYVCIIEAPESDVDMRKRLRNRISQELPFQLQNNVGNGRKLIKNIDVVSIQEWNDHPVYGRYPLLPVSDEDII